MRCCACALLICLLFQPAAAALAGDGVVEINHTRALAGGVTPGDGPGYPVTLSARGSYLLTGDLSWSGNNTNIVEVTAHDVTIDLNGFTIRCEWALTPCAGNGTGVGIYAAVQSNVTVRNGTVRDMGTRGVWLGNAGRVENVRALENGTDGIRVGGSGSVHASTARLNGGAGFYLLNATMLERSVSTLNQIGVRGNGWGILLVDNVIALNLGMAVASNSVPDPIAYRGNTITANNGTTDAADGDQGIVGAEIGTNFCGTDTTCP